MSNGISNIVINPNWFYHRLNEEDFGKIILSGGLKSARMQGVRNGFWNGYDFISLAKKIDRIGNFTSPDYSYGCLIASSYAYVIKDIKAVKARYIKNHHKFCYSLSNLPIPIRFSYWLDEYQARDEIPLEKIIGIKIPYLQSDSIESDKMILSHLLEKMDLLGCAFPFIDVEHKKRIEPNRIEQYIKRR